MSTLSDRETAWELYGIEEHDVPAARRGYCAEEPAADELPMRCRSCGKLDESGECDACASEP